MIAFARVYRTHGPINARLYFPTPTFCNGAVDINDTESILQFNIHSVRGEKCPNEGILAARTKTLHDIQTSSSNVQRKSECI